MTPHRIIRSGHNALALLGVLLALGMGASYAIAAWFGRLTGWAR